MKKPMRSSWAIRRDDTVKVLAGIDRGKQGKIQQVLPGEGKIVVAGVNTRKKNVRARRDRQKGEIIEYNAPIDISNVLLVCPKCGKTTRVGHQILEGRKLRMCKRCKQTLDN